MKTQYVPCIIFSVDKAYNSSNALNRQRVEWLMREKGVQFEKVLGVYQGVEEYSYIVTSLEHTPLILNIAREYQQDSILLRNNENKCHLKFFDGRQPQFLGYMRQVDQDEALKNDAYTYSPRLQQYFRCVV